MAFSLARKFAIASLAFVFAIAFVVGGAWFISERLGTIQDAGASEVRKAMDMQSLAGRGAAMYQVIADGEINHELEQTRTDWQTAKAETQSLFSSVKAKLATAEERKTFADAEANYLSFVELFEQKMLPALDASTEMTPEIRALDGQLDDARSRMTAPLDRLRVAYDASAKKSDITYDDTRKSSMTVGLVMALIVSGIGIAINQLIVRGVTKPLQALAALINKLATGEQVSAIPHGERSDEVGDIARAMRIFKDNLAETERLRESTIADERAKAARNARQLELFKVFQERIAVFASSFVEASGELSDSAQSLAATAEETSRQAQVVAGAADEAANNVQTAAAATEELTASIQEINSQVTTATHVSTEASEEAARTETDIRSLSEAANSIGEVVGLITNIASQTNLLALNATIEAARAGDAGKGFAVVASEVKQLATQTAKATRDINNKVTEIQNATQRTVSSIEKIVSTIDNMRNISTNISSAVEQQGAATNEIAGNTSRAADSTTQVTENIAGVGHAAEMTGAASAQLMSLSSNLTDQAGELQNEVKSFVQQLQAA
ncbi:HAMP domain-containing methyl-accepting chemotaxis protein [Asticcacaulis sp. 201]|uniref:methyl-accepting chemotaxis protein n=1 Tax=Asticcacaulis sp. 201 TaxID=3028787 RepID=UPI002916B0BA|nr:HAMP domain-containing methyl-accepting chemotaxis protein [Asticcacaulis sp. 201]MDV6331219.1 HAMP domain-containing methyl-accepting chemotaxis protein [Asticcacaulis sp. 201]